ncbi:MAG: GrlR family regulatory protein [Pseudomonadota bacterium]
MQHQANPQPAANPDRHLAPEAALLQGLYKVEFETPRGKALGVINAENGKLRGGSSAFAYIGSYTQNGQSFAGSVSSVRHTQDSSHPSVFGFDEVMINFSGTVKGGFAICEGTATEFPSLAFKAVLTRIVD